MDICEQSDVPAAKYWASEYPKRIDNTKRPRNVKPNATATTVPHAATTRDANTTPKLHATTTRKPDANTTPKHATSATKLYATATTKPPAIQPLANGLSS